MVPLAAALLLVLPPALPSVRELRRLCFLLAASTSLPTFVQPRAVALFMPNSFEWMVDVSAFEPQAGVAQSRGVPSVTTAGECLIIVKDILASVIAGRSSMVSTWG